jgi:hypothetical protein
MRKLLGKVHSEYLGGDWKRILRRNLGKSVTWMENERNFSGSYTVADTGISFLFVLQLNSGFFWNRFMANYLISRSRYSAADQNILSSPRSVWIKIRQTQNMNRILRSTFSRHFSKRFRWRTKETGQVVKISVGNKIVTLEELQFCNQYTFAIACITFVYRGISHVSQSWTIFMICVCSVSQNNISTFLYFHPLFIIH